jgi:hypothetical protein
MKRALLLLAACTAHQAPKNVKPPDAGVSISIYAREGGGYSVVDDRRWVEINGSSILLANIDPGADLASLQIEPASAQLRIGTCTRDRLPDLVLLDEKLDAQTRKALFRDRPSTSDFAVRPVKNALMQRPQPIVKCEVAASPGKYLVRILYVSKTLSYRAQHDIELREPTRATITSRFAIETPPWRTRADVILFDGVPSSEKTPTEITRGSVELDGTTAILAIPEKMATAELRRIYDGAVIASEDKRDPMWGHDSVPAVWVWLELANLHLAPGPVHVHVELPDEGIRDAEVAADKRKQGDEAKAPLRLPLWIDGDLRGIRSRIVEYNDGAALSERIVLGIANTGEVAREVFADEHLRPAKHRRIERAWPKKPPPTTGPDEVLRAKLSVAPGRIARAGYTLSYEF